MRVLLYQPKYAMAAWHAAIAAHGMMVENLFFLLAFARLAIKPGWAEVVNIVFNSLQM